MRRTPALAAALALALAAAAEAQQSRVAEIQVAPRYLRMRVDAVAPLVATAYDADGVPVDVPFQWSSSNIHVAEVGPDGQVRGVAPGAAVVTAAVGTGPSKRLGQVSVYVLRPARAMVIAPVPPTPGVDSVPAAPGVWVGPSPAPPAPPSRMHIDSMIRASINCDEPFVNAINPARACWDERAGPREPPLLRLGASVRDVCPHVTRTMVSALVQVSDSGTVVEVSLYGPTGCAEIDQQAEQLLRGLSFRPARRDGQPLRSWLRLQVRTAP